MTEIEFNEIFKMPIYYNEKKIKLKENITTDLELVQNIDPSGNRTMYGYFFRTNSNHLFSQHLLLQIAEYYTTDTLFLRDSQTLLKDYKPLTERNGQDKPEVVFEKYNNIIEIWKEIKNDTGFKEKYYYIDWTMWEFLNQSEQFLFIMSVYNLLSPVISLMLPIFLLIIPFFVIKLKGLDLSMSEYVEVLKIIASNHAIGKLFTEFNDVELNQKVYLMMSAAFYVFSIYQNILVCIRFHYNMKTIHSHFGEIRKYLDFTIENMKNYYSYSNKLETYVTFHSTLYKKIEILSNLKNKLDSISSYKPSIYTFFQTGYVLKYFYEIYDNKEYEDALLYSFGFNSYIDCIEGLQYNINANKICFAKFVKDKKKNVFKNNYYAALIDNKPVKNTIRLNKNLIITGPNASGKTTIIKSTLINVILTQQFGCGFYKSAKLCPYKYIHCYLNIPDTSGRDSLFQSEARRCKEIIDIVDDNKEDTHFCVFDELYSGTNPDDAIVSAEAFMKYLVKNMNVSCLLTTHFVTVCEKLDKNKNIKNYHMLSSKSGTKIIYSYLLKEGISDVKGGLNVLYDMNYPDEIIKSLKI